MYLTQNRLFRRRSTYFPSFVYLPAVYAPFSFSSMDLRCGTLIVFTIVRCSKIGRKRPDYSTPKYFQRCLIIRYLAGKQQPFWNTRFGCEMRSKGRVQHKLPSAAMFTVINRAMISGIQFSPQGSPDSAFER